VLRQLYQSPIYCRHPVKALSLLQGDAQTVESREVLKTEEALHFIYAVPMQVLEVMLTKTSLLFRLAES